MSKLKNIILQYVKEALVEELDIPSQDGTSNGAKPDDQEKAKDATQKGDSVKFVKPGELEEGAIGEDEAKEKITDLFDQLNTAASDSADLEDFANNQDNAKIKKWSNVLGKNLKGALEAISELKKIKDEILAEEKEKASAYGDKVVKCLGKYLKTEEQGMNIKSKYMPFIEKAYKKGKSPKEVADRIKDHRFEM